MKRHLLLMVLSLCFIPGSSQVLNTSDPQVQAALSSGNVEMSPLSNYFQRRTPMMDQLFAEVKNDGEYITYYVGAEVGTAYEDENFQKGKVYYKDEYLGDFYYRHNAYNSEVEVKNTLQKEEKQKALIKDEHVVLILASGEKMRFMQITANNGEIEDAYLTQLNEGDKHLLYRRTHVIYSEAIPAANSMVNPKPSKFTHFTEYYLGDDKSNRPSKLPTKKSKFAKAMKAQTGTDITSYLKENKIQLDNEADLKKTIAYLNSN